MDLNRVAGLGAMVKGAAWWDSPDAYGEEFASRMGDGHYTGGDVFGQMAYEYARRAGVSPEEAEARFGRWADSAIQRHNYDTLNRFVADNSDNPEFVENTLGQHFDNLQRSVPGLWGRNGHARQVESARRQMDRGGYLTDRPVVHGMTGHQILDRGDAAKRRAQARVRQEAASSQLASDPEAVRRNTDIQMYGVARERDPQTGRLLPPGVKPGQAAGAVGRKARAPKVPAAAPKADRQAEAAPAERAVPPAVVQPAQPRVRPVQPKVQPVQAAQPAEQPAPAAARPVQAAPADYSKIFGRNFNPSRSRQDAWLQGQADRLRSQGYGDNQISVMLGNRAWRRFGRNGEDYRVDPGRFRPQAAAPTVKRADNSIQR